MKRERCIEEVFEDMKSNGRDGKHFIFQKMGPSGIGKSKFKKIWQERNKY